MLGFVPLLVMGNPTENQAGTGQSLSVRSDRSGQIRLETSVTPVALVLAGLSKATGIPISSRLNSMEPITRVCSGDSVVPILHCLLGKEADLIIRHGSASKRSAHANINSVEILASSFLEAGEATRAGETDISNPPKPGSATDDLTEVLGMIQSRQPNQRAAGLERLGRMNAVSENTRREAFLAGLKDEEADVRAEAVTGLAMLGGNDHVESLKMAVQDMDPAVRLAAIDAMDISDDNRSTLVNALSDPDETVRELAALRLGIQP